MDGFCRIYERQLFFVKSGHCRFYCILLTIIMLFAGMCPDSFRADSFLGCAVKAADLMQADWQGGTIDSTFDRAFENPVCTAQMLGVQRLRAPQVFLEARNPAGRKTVGFFLCLFFAGAALFLFYLYTVALWGRFMQRRPAAVILAYIHKKDGKK